MFEESSVRWFVGDGSTGDGMSDLGIFDLTRTLWKERTKGRRDVVSSREGRGRETALESLSPPGLLFARGFRPSKVKSSSTAWGGDAGVGVEEEAMAGERVRW